MKKEYYSWILIAIGLIVLAVFASGVMNVAAFSKARARIVEKAAAQQKQVSPAQPPTPAVVDVPVVETAPTPQ